MNLQREKIRPNLIEHHRELNTFKNRSNEEFAPIVGDIVENTQRVISYLKAGGRINSLINDRELNEILYMIDSTRTPDGSKELNEKAEKLLNSFDRTFLWNVYDLFGMLSQVILNKYPYIPHPL